MTIVTYHSIFVALRTEGVDRNMWWGVRKAARSLVALRTEGVDRNLFDLTKSKRAFVALRTEGVDRNKKRAANMWYFSRRPPHGGRG